MSSIMGHAEQVLALLKGSEKDRWGALLLKHLPSLEDGYSAAGDIAVKLASYDLLPSEITDGSEWIHAMGYKKDKEPVHGRIFTFPPAIFNTEKFKEYQTLRRTALKDLHALGCHAVTYQHDVESSKEGDQIGLFLPYVHLLDNPRRMERDVEGEATFLSYLREKNLVTEAQIKEMYPHRSTSFIEDAVASKIEKRLGHALQ